MGILSTEHCLLAFNVGNSIPAVRYDIDQKLNDEQKETARNNIGADIFAQQEQVDALASQVLNNSMVINSTTYRLNDAETKIQANTEAIENLDLNGTKIYNQGRGGRNQEDSMTLLDMYDGLGYGKHISVYRDTSYGGSTVDCGFTVSEQGRENAETAVNSCVVGVVNGATSSNTAKLWYMPIANVSGKGFAEGSITFTPNSTGSVSFMLIKCDGNYDTASWDPGPDVYSLSNYQVGHPITIPFCVKDKMFYGIGIKGSSSSVDVDVNFYHVKFHENK